MLSFSARFLQPCAKALRWSAAANSSIDGAGETRVKRVLEVFPQFRLCSVLRAVVSCSKSHMLHSGIWTCRSCVFFFFHRLSFKTRAEHYLGDCTLCCLFFFFLCQLLGGRAGKFHSQLPPNNRRRLLLLLLPCLAWTVSMVTRPQDSNMYDRRGNWGC